MSNYYTVYNRDDEIVCFGSAKEVANFLNIKIDSFYYKIIRQNRGKTINPKYRFVIEHINYID